MLALLRLMMALEVVLVGSRELVPASRAMLPLGGSELAQLGVILVLLLVQAEIRDYWRREKHGAGVEE